MAQEFLLPDPGEGIYEADIVEVHVGPGDQVKDGDPLFTVETDKAVVDIPSSFDGEISDVRVEAGQTVEVGHVLLTYTSGDTAESPSVDETESPESERQAEFDEGEGETGASSEETSTRGSDHHSERGDRVSKKRPVPASPATRALARRLGVDLHGLEGSGPRGRVEPEDVQTAAEENDQGDHSSVVAETNEETRGTPENKPDDEVEWVDLKGVRRATARQMAKSWAEIPHVTHHDVADITGLEQFRKTYAPEVEREGGKLSITVFLMKAAVAALKEHPRFNATLDMENQRVGLMKHFNIGVAVDTDDGLVVPVVRDVDRKAVSQLAVELAETADRMRRGDRSMDDLERGTFTITNPGGIGGTDFTPIINHPEVAILGAARTRTVAAITDVEDAARGEGRTFDVAPRLHLPLVLAFDHRVNDGADAARFLNSVKALLEDFPRFLLDG